jgi:hypothetical protein
MRVEVEVAMVPVHWKKQRKRFFLRKMTSGFGV